MSSHYSYMAQLAAARRGRRNAGTPAPPSIVAPQTPPPPPPPSPYLFGYNAAGTGPRGRTAGPSPLAPYRQALALGGARASETRTPPNMVDAGFSRTIGLRGIGGTVGMGQPAWPFTGRLPEGYGATLARGGGDAPSARAGAGAAMAPIGTGGLLPGMRGAVNADASDLPPWRFGAAANRLPLAETNANQTSRAMDADPLFAYFRNRLAPREGEESNFAIDSGGETKKGVSQGLLDLLLRNQRERWGYLPERVSDLSPAQIDAIFYSEFYVAPQIAEAAEIPDVLRDSNVVEQLFDAGVLHGPRNAGRMLQKALDKYLGTNLWVWREAPDGSRYKYYDGIVGSDTRDAIDRAIREGRIADVNDAMVEGRIEFISNIIRRDHLQVNWWKGWRKRALTFEMASSSGVPALDVSLRL